MTIRRSHQVLCGASFVVGTQPHECASTLYEAYGSGRMRTIMLSLISSSDDLKT